MAIDTYDFQDGVLSIFTTDDIDTVLADGYLNELRPIIIHDGARPKISQVDGVLEFTETRTMLDVNQQLRVYIGNENYNLIVTGLLPNVTTKKYEDAQLRKEISELQTGIGITPAASILAISVPENSLVFFVAPVSGTFDAWQMVTDDTTEPLFDANTWNTGPIPGQSNGSTIPHIASVTAIEKRYLWLRNGITVTQAPPATSDPNNDGATVPGLVLQYNDTLSPVFSNLSITTGTDGKTQIQVTYTATDTGTGVDAVDVYDASDGGQRTAPLAFDYTSGNDITLPPGVYAPGSDVGVYLVGKDLATQANEIDTSDSILTVTLDANTAAGSLALSTATPEATEGSAITVTATRSSGTDGIVAVEYATPNYEVYPAKPGTNFYGRGSISVTGEMTRDDATYGLLTHTDIANIVNVGETIRLDSIGGTYDANYTGYVTVVADSPPTANTIRFAWAETDGGDPGAGNDDDGTSTCKTGIFYWADGISGDKTLQVNTISVPETTNKMFQGEFTPGTEFGSVSTPSIGLDWHQALINGSGTTTGNRIQEGQVLFDTSQVVAGTDVITSTDSSGTPTAHGYDAAPSTEDDVDVVIYGKDGGTDAIGLTADATSYVAVRSSTTFVLYDNKTDAFNDSGSNFRDITGTGTEYHVLYSQTSGSQIAVCPADDYATLEAAASGETWAAVTNPSGTLKYSALPMAPTAGGAFSVLPPAGPKMHYIVNMTQTGAHIMRTRVMSPTGSLGDTMHQLYEGSVYYGTARLQWTPDDAYDFERLTPLASAETTLSVLTTGDKTVSAVKREAQTIYVDGILLAPSGYTVTGDEVASRIPTTASTDDPDNPSTNVTPGDTSSLTTRAPDILWPADGASDVNLGITPIAVWADATQLDVIATLTDAASNVVGSTTITEVSQSGMRLVMTQAGMDYLTSHTMTVTGTVTVAGIRYAVDIKTTDWNFTTIIDPASTSLALQVDFNNHPVGDYTQALAIADFQIGAQGYTDSINGPGTDGTMLIVNDPTGGGRIRVLETRHFEGTAGSTGSSGGFRFRADLTPADEYYFSYDTMVPAGTFWPHEGWKMPALINGTLLESSHATGQSPTVDGIVGFNSRHQWYGWGKDPSGVNGGRCGIKPIDAYDFTIVYFCDESDANPDNGIQTPWYHPYDRWITTEHRVKMNTADANNADDPAQDLVDGIIEMWVVDPDRGWTTSQKIFTRAFKFRFTNTMKIDGIFMYDHYGGSTFSLNHLPVGWPGLLTASDGRKYQSRFYDNFKVSTSKINP